MFSMSSNLCKTFPVKVIRSRRNLRSFSVSCSSGTDPREIAKKVAYDSTTVVLKPVIDILTSIDNRLEKIEMKLTNSYVEKPDGSYVKMVDSTELKKDIE